MQTAARYSFGLATEQELVQCSSGVRRRFWHSSDRANAYLLRSKKAYLCEIAVRLTAVMEKQKAPPPFRVGSHAAAGRGFQG